MNFKDYLYFFIIFLIYYIFILYRPLQETLFAYNYHDFYYIQKGFFILLVVLLSLIIIFYLKKIYLNKYLKFYLLFTIFQLLYIFLFLKYPIMYIIKSFYDTFGIFYIVILLYLLPFNIKITKNAYTIIILFLGSIVLFSLLYAQLQVYYNDSLMFIYHESYYLSAEIHKIRAFSIFPGGIFDKLMATFVILLCSIILFNKNNYKFFLILIITILMYGIYLSHIRSGYLLVLAGVINLYAFKYNLKINTIIIWNVLVSFTIPFIIVLISFVSINNGSLVSTNSLVDRAYWWGFNINNYLINSDIIRILFGHGLIQSSEGTSYVPTLEGKLWIDNLFLTIYDYQGLIGLILFLTFYIAIIKKLYLTNTKTFYYYFLLSISLAWLIDGIFIRAIGGIALFSLIPIITYIKLQRSH